MSDIKELVEFDKIAAGLSEIQEQGNFVPSMDTKEGYEASKRFVLDVTTPARTKLARAHKDAKAYWLAGGNAVDKKKNEILEALVDIQKPHQDAYKAKDQEEKEKKAKFEAKIQANIDELFNYRNIPYGSNSSFITDQIQSCGEIDTVEGFYTRASEAVLVKEETLAILNDALMSAVANEAEAVRQAEIAEQNRVQQEAMEKQQEQIRLQQEEIDRKQKEIDDKQFAIEEAARLEAQEKQRLINEEIAKVEREQYAKEQAEKAAALAIEQEKQRQYDEKVAADAAKAKLEANKKHTGSVRGEIKEHLMATCGIDDALAVKVVKALLKTNRITINY